MIERILHPLRRAPAIDGDPTQGLPAREFAIASTRPEVLDETAARLTAMSAMALAGTAAEAETAGPDQAAETQSRVISGHPEAPPSPAEDLVKHILGDKHLRTMIRERRPRQTGLRRARAA